MPFTKAAARVTFWKRLLLHGNNSSSTQTAAKCATTQQYTVPHQDSGEEEEEGILGERVRDSGGVGRSKKGPILSLSVCVVLQDCFCGLTSCPGRDEDEAEEKDGCGRLILHRGGGAQRLLRQRQEKEEEKVRERQKWHKARFNRSLSFQCCATTGLVMVPIFL